MATAKAGFEEGITYLVKGIPATFIKSVKGWHRFIDNDSNDALKVRAKDVQSTGKATDAPVAAGQRVFRTFDPETGDVKRQATFNMDRYTRHSEESTEGGFIPLDVNDATADSLRGLGVEQQFEEAARIVRSYGDAKWPGNKTVIEQEMRDRYSKKNPGQIRMNLGNVIRGCISRAARAEAEITEA